MGRYSRILCEHEAAHAAVASVLGLPVEEVRVDQPSDGEDGRCLFQAGEEQHLEAAAVAAAPRVWIRGFRGTVFGRDANVGDGPDRMILTQELIKYTEALPVLERMRENQRLRYVIDTKVRDILCEYGDEVMRIADELQASGRWTRGQGWAGGRRGGPTTWDDVAQQARRAREDRMARRERLARPRVA